MTEPKRDIVDEEDAEAQKAQRNGGLPVSWKNADGTVVGKQSLIRAPSPSETNLFTSARVRTCGQCQHFKHSAFQEIKNKFMAALIHDYQWNPRYLGDDPSKLGRCAQDAELAVGPNSLGCSSFRAK